MSASLSADVIIVGAGLAGLTAARRLAAAGLTVVVLEAGKVAGGRLATEEFAGGLADTGAQFFTVRSAEFAAEVARWRQAGLVYEWSRGWADSSLQPAPPDGFPRYAVRGGFAQLALWLAAGLDVQLRQRVTRIALEDGRWLVTTAAGSWHAPRLLLTPPVPVSLELLAEVDLPAADRAALERITYAPCLCGLFAVVGPVGLPEPGALQRPDEGLSWLADNMRKGLSPDVRILTAHAGPEASARLWYHTDQDILDRLGGEVWPFLPIGTYVTARRLRRWPYALPTRLHPEPVLLAGTALPLAFAGDAFGTARVEGAFLSGQWSVISGQ